jgi:hypothetical protein
MDMNLKILLAATCFAFWPLFMQRSGISGNVSSVLFTLIVFVILTPFIIGGLRNMTDVDWKMLIVAGILGAIGLMAFNSMLAEATKENVSLYAMVVIFIQVFILAIHHIYMNGGISFTKSVGLVMAVMASYLLLKK